MELKSLKEDADHSADHYGALTTRPQHRADSDDKTQILTDDQLAVSLILHPYSCIIRRIFYRAAWNEDAV